MSALRKSFHLFTTIVLSLLLPLSFLLIARLSNLYYLSSIQPRWSSSSSYSFTNLILLLETNPILLHVLASGVTLATFIQCCITFRSLRKCGNPDDDIRVFFRPRLYAAWILICMLQVCVWLGEQGNIVVGMDEETITRIDHSGSRMSLVSLLLYFLGLHETTIQWCKMIVKPVVDDTVWGGVLERRDEENTVEKVVLAFSCGALWWWKLRDEVESMVCLMTGLKMKYEDTRLVDLLSLWLFYVTVSIGVLKLLRSCVWFGIILARHLRSTTGPLINHKSQDIVDKV